MAKMAKITRTDTLFMNKTAEKPYLLGQHIYSPYKGVPPGGKHLTKNKWHVMHALTFINVKVILNFAKETNGCRR